MPIIKRLLWHIFPRRIGARLYGLAALALVTVSVLCAAAGHFVTLAGDTARDIRSRVEVELWRVNEAELLLERHRRIIETAPVELDIDRLGELRAKSAALIAALMQHAAADASPVADSMQRLVPKLAAEGNVTLRLAENFAQAAAIDQVVIYAATAQTLSQEIAVHKRTQMAAVDTDVEALVTSGAVLARWVIAGTVVALFLIGPFSLMVTSQVVRRLKGMTATMQRLSANDTTVYVSGTKYQDELGDMARAMGVFKSNAIALLTYQAEIETLNGRFQFALENMSRGLSMFDGAQRLIVCNGRYRQLYDLPDQLCTPGTHVDTILAHRIQLGTGRVGDIGGGTRLDWPFDHSVPDGAHDKVALTHELTDGRMIQIAYQPLVGGGWVALHEDVTDERRQEARISRLAHIDTVTGIANRHAFQERLAAALHTTLAGHLGFAVHWIDLDRFKEVNDTFGHPVGDALLLQVASRLAGTVRLDDIVARLGGDEFAVLQRDVEDMDEARALADRIIKNLAAPYDLAGQRVEIGASAGVVLAPCHGTTADDLIRNADMALYRAKADGRGCHVVFDASLEQEQKARRGLSADILDAIATNSFTLAYQPILDLARGEVTVCEALLRWHHPTRGWVPPAVFIPIAEENGSIVALGAWALQRACEDAKGWAAHIKVAVNLSAVQFQRPGLGSTVSTALAASGLAPQRLELEITETILLSDDTATLATLHQFRALGISIALDDFGTGYSSLNYLRRFPFDKIKIDQTFIRDLPSRAESVAIVRAIADLAKTLRMVTVAEGVETAEHLQRVATAGCDLVQGYLISRPVAPDALANAICHARTVPLVQAA
jgi:diguanylate cyclase (GGDEF)-like protein